MILVTGFGPFQTVVHNPSGLLARRLDGRRLGGETILGELLPVSYVRATQHTVAVARKHRVRLVLGIGVAESRPEPWVEARAVAGSDGRPDVDGDTGVRILQGAPELRATLAVESLAAALGCGVSTDAGRYVCNGWLYRVTQDLPGVSVGFLHVPRGGMAPALVEKGLAALLG